MSIMRVLFFQDVFRDDSCNFGGTIFVHRVANAGVGVQHAVWYFVMHHYGICVGCHAVGQSESWSAERGGASAEKLRLQS
jgi:hypothetical protein